MRELSGPEDPEIGRALAALAARMRNEEAPAHVEAAVLAQFRHRHSRRTTVRFRWAAVGSVAAAGLIAAVLVGRREDPTHPMPPPKLTHAASYAPQPPLPAAPVVRRMAPNRLQWTGEAPAAQRREVTSDFFPLMPGPMVDAGEPASLLRVSLPRSAMRRFGIPPGNNPFEAVQADVVVGQDGMARAVRFVSVRR